MGQWKFDHLPILASLWIFLLQSVSHIYFLTVCFSGGGFEGKTTTKMSTQVKTGSVIDWRGQGAGLSCRSKCDWSFALYCENWMGNIGKFSMWLTMMATLCSGGLSVSWEDALCTSQGGSCPIIMKEDHTKERLTTPSKQTWMCLYSHLLDFASL